MATTAHKASAASLGTVPEHRASIQADAASPVVGSPGSNSNPDSFSATDGKMDMVEFSVSKRLRVSVSAANAMASVSKKMLQESFEVNAEEEVSTAGPMSDEYIVLPEFKKHSKPFDEQDHSWCCAQPPVVLEAEERGDSEPSFPTHPTLSPNRIGLYAAVQATHGDRKYMEDRHRIHYGKGDAIRGIFGIFDGHGGEESSQFTAEHLHLVAEATYEQHVRELEDGQSLDYKRLCEAVVEEMETKILDLAIEVGFTDGTTAVWCMVVGNDLICCNTGDSRAVLCRKGKAVALSIDHKPHFPEERQRIETNGGTVDQALKKSASGCCFGSKKVRQGAMRLWPGGFSVSRALGDIMHKIPFTNLLISDADVTVNKLCGDDQFVILASDGFWDVIDNDLAVEFALQFSAKYDPQAICDKMVDMAYKRGSDDNISVMMVFFTHHSNTFQQTLSSSQLLLREESSHDTEE